MRKLLIVLVMVGLLLPAIPGAPLIFGGILAVAWADGFTRIGLVELVILGALTLVISAIDFFASFSSLVLLGRATNLRSAWWIS